MCIRSRYYYIRGMVVTIMGRIHGWQPHCEPTVANNWFKQLKYQKIHFTYEMKSSVVKRSICFNCCGLRFYYFQMRLEQAIERMHEYNFFLLLFNTFNATLIIFIILLNNPMPVNSTLLQTVKMHKFMSRHFLLSTKNTSNLEVEVVIEKVKTLFYHLNVYNWLYASSWVN